MNEINVEEIIKKHLGENYSRDKESIAAIKEIVEAVIDKCAEEADWKILDSGIGEYAVIDKESILSIKNKIKYE